MFRLVYNKKLLVDSSAEEFARVKALLNTAKIKYYVRTIKSTPAILQGAHVGYYARYNMPYTVSKDHISYVYYIYVKNKDFKRAREISFGD